jgi:hypothetical protein
MEQTLFDYVDEDLFYIYRTHGFNWEEARYINIFRWLWNEKHYRPHIDAFPGSESNLAYVVLQKPSITGKSYKFTAESYDEAIINIVKHIGNNYEEYLQ